MSKERENKSLIIILYLIRLSYIYKHNGEVEPLVKYQAP